MPSDTESERGDYQFEDIIRGLHLRKFFENKDVVVLGQKLQLLQSNLDRYKEEIPWNEEVTSERNQFAEAGEKMRSSVAKLLLDDDFLKALKDEQFRTDFFATLDSFAKIAANPTKMNHTDAETFNNFDNAMKMTKSSIWPSKRTCFIAFLVLAAAVCLTSFILTGGLSAIPVVAIAAVAYAHTLGAAGITLAAPIVKAGITTMAPIVKAGITTMAPVVTAVESNVAAQTTAAIAAEVGSGLVIGGVAVAKTSSNGKDASATKKLSEELKTFSENYKKELKEIHEESKKSEAPETPPSDRRFDL